MQDMSHIFREWRYIKDNYAMEAETCPLVGLMDGFSHMLCPPGEGMCNVTEALEEFEKVSIGATLVATKALGVFGVCARQFGAGGMGPGGGTDYQDMEKEGDGNTEEEGHGDMDGGGMGNQCKNGGGLMPDCGALYKAVQMFSGGPNGRHHGDEESENGENNDEESDGSEHSGPNGENGDSKSPGMPPSQIFQIWYRELNVEGLQYHGMEDMGHFMEVVTDTCM